MTTRSLGSRTRRPRSTRPAALSTLWTGLAASATLTVAALLDQALFGSLETHVAQVYTPYGVPWQGAAVALLTSLLILGAAGSVGWLVVARGALRRRGWAAPAGTVLLLLGLATSVPLVTAQEYGHTLVPTWLGVLGLLPGVVGVAATVQLWRDRSRPGRG